MYEIEKCFSFEAGHVLLHHDGKCSTPHGHSYHLKIVLRSDKLIPSGPKTNMVIDFSDVSSAVKPMIFEYFDHRWINDTLKTDASTVEFMAKWIYDHLKPKIPCLHKVTLFETPSCSASYFEL